MKVCPACQHKQESGKFCGKCGSPLAEATKEASVETETPSVEQETTATNETVTPTAQVAPNEQLEKVKAESKQYFNYFLQQLKKPSAGEAADAKNHYISLGLYVLITAIAIYALISGFLGSYASYLGGSLFQVILYAIVFLALLIAVNVLAIFLTTLLFSEGRGFTEVLTKIGSYFAIPVVISLLGLLLAIVKSMTMASLVIYLGVIIAFGLIPIYVVSKYLHEKSKTVDPLYAFLVYFGIVTVLFVIVGMFLADSALGEMLQYVDSIF